MREILAAKGQPLQIKSVARPLFFGLLAVLAFVLLGCSAQATGGGPTAVDTSNVSMAKSYRFDPVVIRVAAGTTVTWTNDDNFTHDVHLLSGDGWNSQPLRPGQSVSHTFNDPGEYNYECSFHPQDMKGKIIVVAR